MVQLNTLILQMEKCETWGGNLIGLAHSVSCDKAGREPRCPDSKSSILLTAHPKANLKGAP